MPAFYLLDESCEDRLFLKFAQGRAEPKSAGQLDFCRLARLAFRSHFPHIDLVDHDAYGTHTSES